MASKIVRGSPWRAAPHQDGIRIPPKITSRCPFTPCLGSPEVCSKQSRFSRRVLSILPPGPLTATAHLQPLAQPTALRHPESRCDIDSHPDCRATLQDHGREVLLPVIAGLALGEMVDEFVILVDAERAVRRQALHRERSGDPDDAPILVGLVVQVLVVRLGGDGGIDLFLTRNARLPPAAVQVRRAGVPRVARLAGDVLKCVVAAYSVVQRQQLVSSLCVGLG